jgi:cell wall-associated NlpC family hydrolase
MKKFLYLLLILAFIFQPICFASPLVKEAKLHLNKPYVYAMTGPNSFDCSGFTYYCVDKVYNIQLFRTAVDQGYDDTYLKIENIE